MKILVTLIFTIILFGFSYSLHAQELVIADEQESDGQMLSDFERRIQLQDPQVNVSQIPSLFLSGNEINLLIDAKAGLYARPPTQEELNKEQENINAGIVSRPDSVREISLGGILFQSSSDWAIWLNSQKITPENLPPAIMDIKVKKDFIQLKWLDFQTNQIFPVKLRANQRFNFDTRMFLPG